MGNFSEKTLNMGSRRDVDAFHEINTWTWFFFYALVVNDDYEGEAVGGGGEGGPR